MKSVIYFLLVAILFSVVVNSQQPTCTRLPTTSCGRTGCNIWYVDPVRGNDANNGTKAGPWKSLQNILNTKVETRGTPKPWDKQTPPRNFTVKNQGAPVKGGDVIVLAAGNHGKVLLREAYNTLPITITREPNVYPVLDTFTLAQAANWRVYCLNVTSTAPNPSLSLLSVASDSWGGPSYNVVLENNTIFSYPSLTPYRTNATKLYESTATGIGLSSLAKTITVSGNYIYHVKRGISSSATYVHLTNNTINYFIGDGFRILNNDSLVEFNLVQNNMNVDGGADHRDGLQMFTNGNRYSLRNITVRYNKFLAGVDPNRPFASTFQGVVSFDVPLDNVTVLGNLIVTSYWHGVALYHAKNCKVIANTLVDPNNKVDIWISFDGNSTTGNLAQNNIAEATYKTGSATLITNVIKKLTPTDQATWFVSPTTNNWHLKNVTGSPFIGVATAAGAPTRDLDNKRRVAPYDAGCYEL